MQVKKKKGWVTNGNTHIYTCIHGYTETEVEREIETRKSDLKRKNQKEEV